MSRSDVGVSLPAAKSLVAQHIIEVLRDVPGICSVTFVGSFVDRNDLSGISDIDTVVVFDDLTPSRFDAAVAAVSALTGAAVGFPRCELLVNSTLGPLKHDRPGQVVVHLMLYDRRSHREHVLKSPFTCLDWERSPHVWGERLSALYPVGRLEPRDFLAARRGLANYVSDLESGTLSYRRFASDGDRMIEVPDRIALDRRHQGEYAYHIVRNLIVNALKMRTGQNRLWDEASFRDDWARELPDLVEWMPFYDRVRDMKLARHSDSPADTLPMTRGFLHAFSASLDRAIDGAFRLRLVRHARTPLSDGTLLGQGRDPGVADAGSIPAASGDWAFVQASPLRRAVETARALVPEAVLRTDERLAEINYGRAEGLRVDELRQQFPQISAAWDGGDDAPFPGGECTDGVLKRVRSFLDSVASSSGRGLVVTHNVVMRAVAADLLGLDIRRAHRLPIAHLDALDICCVGGRWLPDWGSAVKARLLDGWVGWADGA